MPTTGYLRERNGRYYAILNLYDSNGKRIQKSHPTGLLVKNNKRKAEQFLKKLCVEYDNKNLNFYSNIKVADYFENGSYQLKRKFDQIPIAAIKVIWKTILFHISEN